MAYWAAAFAKNPHDELAAVKYARALKLAGAKDKALSLLEQAAIYNPDSRIITSEEGRLALDVGDKDLAEKLLARADDPDHPDWRVRNALGTLAAQKGDREKARHYFEQANELAPNEAAVINNLALIYALAGDPAKAEALLRKAQAAGGDPKKVRQNLALVLGVQGKFDEARDVASADVGSEQADANRAYLQRMVQATPIPLGKAPTSVASATPVKRKRGAPVPTDAAAATNGWNAEANADAATPWANTVAVAK
jgi:Flp pilus assembly protein TadD